MESFTRLRCAQLGLRYDFMVDSRGAYVARKVINTCRMTAIHVSTNWSSQALKAYTHSFIYRGMLGIAELHRHLQ